MEVWLSNLEKEMRHALRASFAEAKSSKRRGKVTTCAQVALLVQRVKWTRDVEFAIDASLKRNDLSAWDDLYTAYKQDAKEKAEV